MKKSLTHAGFTLLETLLVLAVISLIAVSGLAAYQQRINNFKVEKTALQIQSLLEASMDYHLDHVSSTPSWPASNADLANYLPNLPLNSCPWYNINTQCYFLSVVANTFFVSITIPTTQVNAPQLAQMIATRLPNAIATGRQVIAYEPIPPVPPTPTPSGVDIVSINAFVGTRPITGLKGCAHSSSVHHLYLMLSGVTNPGWDLGDPARSLQWAVPIGYGGIYNNPNNMPHAAPPYSNAVTLANNVTSYTPHVWTLDGSEEGIGPQDSAYSNGIAIETCEGSSSTTNDIETDKKNTLPIQY